MCTTRFPFVRSNHSFNFDIGETGMITTSLGQKGYIYDVDVTNTMWILTRFKFLRVNVDEVLRFTIPSNVYWLVPVEILKMCRPRMSSKDPPLHPTLLSRTSTYMYREIFLTLLWLADIVTTPTITSDIPMISGKRGNHDGYRDPRLYQTSERLNNQSLNFGRFLTKSGKTITLIYLSDDDYRSL